MNIIRALCIVSAVLCTNVIAKQGRHSKNVPIQTLIAAIKKGDMAQVESVIKSGVNVNENDEESGYAPLHYSAGAGLEQITKFLIDNGAVVDVRCDEGKTPLQIAAENGLLNIVQQLIKAGANIDNVDDDGFSIIEAIIGAMPAVESMMYSNSFLNDTYVEFDDQEKCCLFLIEHGANVNKINATDTSMTALHSAVWSDFYRVAEALIKAGANVNSVTTGFYSVGSTPLHLHYTDTPFVFLLIGEKSEDCVFRCFLRSSIVELLIKNGADVNLPASGSYNHTPFHLAIMKEEDVNVINSMIENGADINHLTDDSGNTSLHMAVQNARVPVVKLLIKAGSLVNATNKDLNAPLHVIGEVEKTVAKLLKNGENVNADNYEDDLHSIAEILIDNGANVNAKNANGKTPLDLVTNEKIRKLFVEKMALTNKSQS